MNTYQLQFFIDTIFSEELRQVKTESMTEHNIGLAFGLCGLACLFSILGSCAPFLDLFPIFSFKIADSHLVLAGSLSLTCGILIFLSLVDIFPDAVSKFASSELVDPIHAKILTLGFFCVGILTMVYSFLQR